MDITTMGIDLAKNVFQLHGVNKSGKAVCKKKLSRQKLIEYIAKLPSCLIGMEACGGSNYWARKFREFGHDVKIMGAQFVKPYVKSNKNDALDAEAICEAVRRPTMRFVAAKTIEQQDIQSMHRIRTRIVKQRTALANQIRGLLAEYGMVIAQGINQINKVLPSMIENNDNELSSIARELFNELLCEFRDFDDQVKKYDLKIESICKNNEVCQRLIKLEGVGVLTATAMVATIGDAKVFKSGRELSAFMGLVPKQFSSGGKTRLLGISKRGDRYLRCLLIHGARAAMFHSKNMSERKHQWLTNLIERRGRNRAIVALANKNVRIMWNIMAKEVVYNREA